MRTWTTGMLMVIGWSSEGRKILSLRASVELSAREFRCSGQQEVMSRTQEMSTSKFCWATMFWKQWPSKLKICSAQKLFWEPPKLIYVCETTPKHQWWKNTPYLRELTAVCGAGGAGGVGGKSEDLHSDRPATQGQITRKFMIRKI